MSKSIFLATQDVVLNHNNNNGKNDNHVLHTERKYTSFLAIWSGDGNGISAESVL